MNNKWTTYTLFFVVVILLQVFLLNNITLSTRLAPIVYVVLLIMLPFGMSQISILFVGLLIGIVMDVAMGVEGLNVIATLPVAFFRNSILHYIAGVSSIVNTGVPSGRDMGSHRLHRYVVSMTAIHSALFFGFESLSFSNPGFFIARLLCSFVVSLIIVYILILIFMPKLTQKV